MSEHHEAQRARRAEQHQHSDAEDKLAIREVIDRYALSIDAMDWGIYRDVFSRDAMIDYSDSGGSRADLETTIAWLEVGLAFFAGLHHNMTTHVCELDGDTAKGITYFIAYHTLIDAAGVEQLMEIGGFYQDRFVRQDKWRIAERVELGIWTKGQWPAGATPPPWHGTAVRHRPHMLAG
jgi:hypothetical protein